MKHTGKQWHVILKNTYVAYFSIYCLPVCEVSSCVDSSIPPSLLPTSRLFKPILDDLWFKRSHWQSRWAVVSAHFPVGSELHASNWPSCLGKRVREMWLSLRSVHVIPTHTHGTPGYRGTQFGEGCGEPVSFITLEGLNLWSKTYQTTCMLLHSSWIFIIFGTDVQLGVK